MSVLFLMYFKRMCCSWGPRGGGWEGHIFTAPVHLLSRDWTPNLTARSHVRVGVLAAVCVVIIVEITLK